MDEQKLQELITRFPKIKDVPNSLVVPFEQGQTFKRYPTVTFKHPGNDLKNLSVSENLLTAIATDPKFFL